MEATNPHHGGTGTGVTTVTHAENNRAKGRIGKARVSWRTNTARVATTTVIGAEESVFSSHV
jgi:hypothetical protein